MDVYTRFRWAEDLFGNKDYYAAASILEGILAQDNLGARHSLTAVRELLARAYFHSAQTQRAEETARALLEDDPSNGYAALLLARSLQRRSRHDEAERAMRLATALGAPGTAPDNTP